MDRILSRPGLTLFGRVLPSVNEARTASDCERVLITGRAGEPVNWLLGRIGFYPSLTMENDGWHTIKHA